MPGVKGGGKGMGMTIKGRTGDLGGDGTFYSLTVVAGTPTYTCDKTTQTTHTHTHTHGWMSSGEI